MRLFEGIGREFSKWRETTFELIGRTIWTVVHLSMHHWKRIGWGTKKLDHFPSTSKPLFPSTIGGSESSYTPPGCLESWLGKSFVFLYAWVSSKVKSLISFFKWNYYYIGWFDLYYWLQHVLVLIWQHNLTFCLTFDLLH